MPFTGANLMLSFSQPNFCFHATTAYAILRAQGVKLGKRDFMGRRVSSGWLGLELPIGLCSWPDFQLGNSVSPNRTLIQVLLSS